MAAFPSDSSLNHEPDFLLAANGPVTLFWSQAVLGETTEMLVGRGYDVVIVDTVTWTAEQDAHQGLASALDFPDHYGANLSALNDCLRDVAAHDCATSECAAGSVLVLTGYNHFAAREPALAHSILDMYADQARSAALIGHRMLCLVQSDDPKLYVEPVGAARVGWNAAEWLDSRRGPNPSTT